MNNNFNNFDNKFNPNSIDDLRNLKENGLEGERVSRNPYIREQESSFIEPEADLTGEYSKNYWGGQNDYLDAELNRPNNTPKESVSSKIIKSNFFKYLIGAFARMALIYFANPFGVFDSKEVKEFKIKLANNNILREKIAEKSGSLLAVTDSIKKNETDLEGIKKVWFEKFSKMCGYHKQENSVKLDETITCSEEETKIYLSNIEKKCSKVYQTESCTNKEKVAYIRSMDGHDLSKFFDTGISSLNIDSKKDNKTSSNQNLKNVFSFDQLDKQIDNHIKNQEIKLSYVQWGKKNELFMKDSKEDTNSLKRDSNIKIEGIEWHNTRVPKYADKSNSLYEKSVSENFKDETGKYLSWGNSLIEIQNSHKQRFGSNYIAYHFIVLEDGTVLNTRPLDLIASWDLCGSKKAAGSRGCRPSMSTSDNWNNFRFIQANFIGDWAPNKAQLDSMKKLSQSMAKRFKFELNENTLFSHNEFSTEKSTKENFLFWIKWIELTDENKMFSDVRNAKLEFLK